MRPLVREGVDRRTLLGGAAALSARTLFGESGTGGGGAPAAASIPVPPFELEELRALVAKLVG